MRTQDIPVSTVNLNGWCFTVCIAGWAELDTRARFKRFLLKWPAFWLRRKDGCWSGVVIRPDKTWWSIRIGEPCEYPTISAALERAYQDLVQHMEGS